MGTSWYDVNLGGVRRSTSNGPDAINLVTNELRSKLRYSKVRANRAMCQCPYHVSDTGFSMTLDVNLNPNRVNGKGFQVPVGYFHCWSCFKSGPWNQLAETLGLEKLEETDNPHLHNQLSKITWEEEYYPPETSMLFDIEEHWVRKDGVIKMSTLLAYNCKIWMKVVQHDGELESRRKLFIPVEQNHELVGHVEARLDPEDVDPDPKYLNAAGPWASQHWLGYDVVCNTFDTNYIALVEGAADAMMMFQRGIPALPLLGVTSWSDAKKAAIVTRFEHVVIVGDGDNAGKSMRKFLKPKLNEECYVHLIKLPAGEDPASLDKEQYKDLKSLIKKKVRNAGKER